MPAELSQYRRSVYSQNGEDGVIAEILRRLGVSQGWFCEFGAWDGRYGSNTYNLLRLGWSGVMIECEPQRFQRLRRLAQRYPGRLHALCRLVGTSGPDGLDSILSETPIPRDFAVLSIDIDGADYHVWGALSKYRPLVVVIEITSAVLPGVIQIAGEDDATMTSFTPMLKLGESKGYRLVCHTGNMIFVRDDDAVQLGLNLSDPESLFDGGYVTDTLAARLRRKSANISPQRVALKALNFIRG